MNSTPYPFVERFNLLVDGVLPYLWITRAAELQSEQAALLDTTIDEVVDLKATAVRAGDEEQANTLLGYECLAKALRAELNMWLELKRDDPDKAWGYLIEAEIEVSMAIRASPGFSGLASYRNKLDRIEHEVFPPQVFMSMGMITRRRECSICHSNIDDCDHLPGLPYWGEICHAILIEAVPDHVALVKNPANKRCRVVFFEENGKKKNRMSWRVENVAFSNAPEAGRRAEGILMDTKYNL